MGCVNSPHNQNELSRNLSFAFFDMSVYAVSNVNVNSVTITRRFSTTVSNLEEQVGEERERGKAAEQRIGRLSKEVWQKEEERAAAERAGAERAGQREAAEARVKGLEAQVEEQATRVSDD